MSLSAPPTRRELTRLHALLEQIFALVTRKLQFSSAPATRLQAEERPSEGGLGFHSSKDEVLPLSLTVRNPWADVDASHATKGKSKRSAGGSAGRKGDEARQEVTVEVEVHQSLGDLRNRKGDTGTLRLQPGRLGELTLGPCCQGRFSGASGASRRKCFGSRRALCRAELMLRPTMDSLHLARYLVQQHHFPHPSHPPLLPLLSSSTVLELGSGTGFLGMALRDFYTASTTTTRRDAASGRWVFSDQLANLALVVRNLRANGLIEPPSSPSSRTTALPPYRHHAHGTASSHPPAPSRGAKANDKQAPPPPPAVEVIELDWVVEAAAWDRHPHSLYSSSSRTAHPPLPSAPSLIVASDCIFNPSLSAPLAKTILRHAGAQTVVLVASEVRDEEPLEEFLTAWKEEGGERWTIWRACWEGEGEMEAAGELADGLFVVWVGWQEEAGQDRQVA